MASNARPGGGAGWVGAVLGAGALTVGCGVTPIDRQIEVGVDPFLVFVAEGRDGVTDLFAGTPAGGTAWQLTFSRPAERIPRLAPAGTALAFLRELPGGKSELVVMNLLNGAERTTLVPEGARPITALAWAGEGTRIFVRGAEQVLATPAPPATLSLAPLEDSEHARADSAFAVLLGDPPLARVVDCETGDGSAGSGRTLCTEAADGLHHLLVAGAEEPFRWGTDSVAWRIGSSVVIRPLAGGRSRQIEWTAPPTGVRELTVFVPGR